MNSNTQEQHANNQKSLWHPVLKSYGSNSDFHVFGDIDRDRWPILVLFLDNLDIIPGYLHI